MGRGFIGLTVCVLLLSSYLTNQQPLFNSSEVSVSVVTDSWASLLNATTAPQTVTPKAAAVQTPEISPTCNEKFSCQHKCNNKSTEWDEVTRNKAHCHCDHACLQYHDCCADFARFCETDTPVNQGNENTNYSCTKLSTEFGQTVGVFMISTCAANWQDEYVSSKCFAGSKTDNRTFTSENIDEDIPVTFLSPLKPGVNYRNIYCGLCNNVPSKYFLPFWKLKFRCNIRPPLHYNATQTLDFMLKYCPSRIVQPHKDFKIRTCLPTVSTCSLANQTEHRDGCLKGVSGVIFSKKTTRNYKNYDCLLCNGVSTNGTKCGPQVKEDIFNPKSFEIIMEFVPSPKKPVTKLKSVTSTCNTGSVFDPHLELCRTGYFPDPSTAVRDKYRVKLWMYPEDVQMRSLSPDDFRNGICARFLLDPSQIDEISIASEDSAIAVAFNLYAGAAAKSYDGGNMKYQDTLNVTVLLSFNQSFEISIANKTWTVLRVTQRQLSCVKSEEFLPGEFELLPTRVAVIKKTGQELLPNRYFLVKHQTGNDSLFVCTSKFIVKCPFVLLPVDSSEYKIFDNKSLLHTTTGRIYTTGEYDLDDRTALICTNYTKVNYTNHSVQEIDPKTNDRTKSESVFLRYFTIVGFSVSIFTLILTLVVHFIFSELRAPLPGKNLMSLCVALLLAQFMWLFGTGDTDKPTFCTVMAAVLHYLFLVSFACTAIIAFDTRRTFSSQMSKAPGRSIGSHSKNLRFLAYTCLAWGGPLVFVGICVVLDHFQVVDIGYDDNEEACWLVNSNAKIVTFATPIACVLLYNVAAFSHTVWAINTARKQTTRAKSARQDQSVILKIYVRLVTLMGFTWFFSFSAELIHKALLYPFVVLTTLQGVYLFLAFVCKRRVLTLMKNSFPRSRKDILASTQHTASTDCKSLPPYTQYRSETEETHM